MSKLSAIPRPIAVLQGRLAMPEARGGEPYTGVYTVTPGFEGTTLPTKDKLLAQDITVEPIEVARVSNPSGGKTIFIGGLIDG